MLKNFPLKKIGILVCILAVPGFLYYLLQAKGKNRYRPLAVYGPKVVAPTFHKKFGKKIPDTIYHKIDDFSLVNQKNASVKYPDKVSKIAVFSFFKTTPETAAIAIVNSLKPVVQTYKKNPIINFYSISVDASDKPEILLNFAKKHQLNTKKWQFLSGDTASIYKISRKGFLLDAMQTNDVNNQIIYSNKLILTDSQKRIRGYYDSSSSEDVIRLIDEIKVLISEELRNTRDGR